jgi:murein DD-endopeptidase MepM/ murein hydrolase activator NlpD
MHVTLAAVAASVVFFALLLPSGEVQATRRAMPILSADIDLNPQRGISSLVTTTRSEPTLIASSDASTDEWKELTVRKGDNLAKLFDRAGLSTTDMREVLQSGPAAKSLAHAYPGQKLAFKLDQNGQLVALRYDESPLSSTHFNRDENSFAAEKISREPEVHQQLASGSITSSFHKSGLNAGLSDAMIQQLAEIFGSEIDLLLDLRPSDQFTVLYDAYYVDGKKIGNGPILAASFINNGNTHSAFRYIYTNGEVGYFSEEGVSMRKTFMRAPLNFINVVSSFSANRIHPLFKTGRPHLGIDYAAPTGTPVYAAGDGRVVESGSNDSMGNYVVIQHDGTYSTKYLHLKKRSVKVGDRVTQHQVIGAVGSTGWATGPHLHYEFLVNGVHTDPAKIARKLPQASHIALTEQRRFGAQVRNLMAQLATNTTQNTLARQDNLAADKRLKNL